ncbi:MAG: hypothetical protein AB8H80_15210 [Planctomycetota bacterium]
MLRSTFFPSIAGCTLPLASVLLPMFACAPTSAQSPGDWRSVDSVNSPTARTGYSLIENMVGEILLIGGDSSNPQATDWLWDGIDWRPANLPVPRRDNAAVGRFGDGRLILYGGSSAGAFFTDTWISTNTPNFWFNAGSNSPPGILTDSSMAYDAGSDRIVLIGRDTSGTYTTWFRGSNLSSPWLAGPTFVATSARVAEDELRQEAVLITSQPGMTDVLRLEGGQWLPVSSSSIFLALDEVAFDVRRGRLTLHEARDSRSVLEFDGRSFDPSGQSAGSLVATSRTAMVYSRLRSEMLLVANYAGTVETYRHAVDAAPMSLAYGDSCGGVGALGLRPGDRPVPGAAHRLLNLGNSAPLVLGVLGFSHVENAGMPLPQMIPLGGASCELRVESRLIAQPFGTTNPTLSVSLPNSAAILGERYDAQFVMLDASGIAGSTNGLEVQIGQDLAANMLREQFLSDLNRDSGASSDSWGNGAVTPGLIGGDGRHGSFSPSIGTEVEPDVFVIDTSNTTVPASATLSGMPEQVTDGRFYFTDFHVPANVTVRFVGSSPATLRVRGLVDVQGTVTADGADSPTFLQTSGPAAGVPSSRFEARSTSGPVMGQPGTAGGPGAGRGGVGGNECDDQGPNIVNGRNLYDGESGQGLLLSAGHAYSGNEFGSGGSGSLMTPATGMWGIPVPLVPAVPSIYCGYFSPGGAGGGYSTAGGQAAVPQHNSPGSTIVSTSPVTGGSAFSLFPYPPPGAPAGYSSLEHFSVGGSGGGGGGSHGYGLLGIGAAPERWMAGHGGTGGGGVLVLRAGGDVRIDGRLSARGGNGPLIQGAVEGGLVSPPNFGISSPGGGGSGGSLLLQSGGDLTGLGSIDARGGAAGYVGLFLASELRGVDARGGDGADGFVRLESDGLSAFNGVQVPAAGSGTVGQLTDRDDRTGSRSLFLQVPSPMLPIFERYELLVEIDGLPVLFSDDPSVSPLAADDPNGAVVMRLQAAEFDPVNGAAVAGTEGPWRSAARPGADSINLDRGDSVRFDLALDQSQAQLRVLDLRIVWR